MFPSLYIYSCYLCQTLNLLKSKKKEIEIQNFEPKKIVWAYVCVNISENPPGARTEVRDIGFKSESLRHDLGCVTCMRLDLHILDLTSMGGNQTSIVAQSRKSDNRYCTNNTNSTHKKRNAYMVRMKASVITESHLSYLGTLVGTFCGCFFLFFFFFSSLFSDKYFFK